MSNPAELALVQKALTLGLGGCVEWDEKVADRVEQELARHSLSLNRVRTEVIRFARNGGGVHQIKEEREPWKNRRDYWYKAVVPMPSLLSKGLFVEMELVNMDSDYPEVRLVNAHEQV